MSFTLSLLVFLTCLQPGWSQCNGRTLVLQLELFTKVYIQSPGFQAGEYSQNLSCAWRFDRSRNTSEIIYTLHLKGMKNTPDTISLYGGVDNTGTVLIDTTTSISQDYTQRKVVDHSSLFLLFRTDDVESNDGEGFEMYILESADYSGTDCLTTKQIQPQPTTQYLTSPNFPQNYPLDTNCAWNITTADEVIVSVIYMDVEMNTPSTCYDYVTIGDSGRLCAFWEFNFNRSYVFNDSFLITFTSDDQERKHGFVLSYVERKYNATEEQTSMTTTYPATDVPTDTSTGISTTGVASSSETISVSKTSTIHSTATIETTSTTTLTDSTTNIHQAWSQCNGTTLVVQLQLFTKVKIQSPSFQAGQYPQNLSCAWRFDRSRNTSEIIYTIHLKRMKNTPDTISLYGGVNKTGTALIDTTTSISQDYTQRMVVDHSSLFLLFTTDDVESNDGDGFEMYILESADYSGTDCLTTKQIQPQPTTQYLTSPNFPQKYPINTNCAWNITTTYDVIVSVIYMDVETEPPTCYDYVTIGDSGRLCANWEFNINMTYVFNDSFLITFTSDNMQPEHGFVLSYVARYDNTTEAPTSMKPEVETTTNIDLSTTQQSTSNTETTTDELSTSLYSTSTAQTSTSEAETLSSSHTSTLNSITSTASTLVTTSHQQISTDKQKTTYPPTDVQPDTSTDITTTGVASSSETISVSKTSTIHSTHAMETTTYTSSSSEASTKYQTTDDIGTIPTTNLTDSTTVIQQSTSGSTTTVQPDTLTVVPTTGASFSSETVSVSETSTQYKTTDSIETTETIMVDSTTTIQPEEETLSPEAMVVIITGAIVGVTGIGVLIGIVSFLILKSSTSGKSNKYAIDSMETIDTHTTEISVPPRWIQMIDRMKKNNYNPTYLEHESH